MAKERILVVKGPPGTTFRVVSRGQDAEGEGTTFFNGAVDGSGSTRVPISIRSVVVTGFPGAGGSVPVEFGVDEWEKEFRLPV